MGRGGVGRVGKDRGYLTLRTQLLSTLFFFRRLSKITSLWAQEKNPSQKRLSRAAKKKTWEQNHSLKLTHKLKRSQVKQPASELIQKPSHLQDSTQTKQLRAQSLELDSSRLHFFLIWVHNQGYYLISLKFNFLVLKNEYNNIYLMPQRVVRLDKV